MILGGVVIKFKKIQFIEQDEKFTFDDRIVVIERDENQNPLFAHFRCPCGCGKEIILPLYETSKPYWDVFIKKRNVSFYPSIYLSNSECQSHFWIIKNKVLWSEDLYEDYY